MSILSSRSVWRGSAAVALSLMSAWAWGQQKTFDIPAEDAVKAIPEFGRQAGIQIIAPASQLQNVRTPAVKGNLELHEALKALLQGTGLEIADDDGRMITLRKGAEKHPAPASKPAQRAKQEKTTAKNEEETPQELERVQVTATTGTHIIGAPPASPVIAITQEQAIEAGQTNLGEVIRSIPQNFTGGQNPGDFGGGSQANSNINGGSALNLRGLGPDATLTLLNGHRLSYGGYSQAVDISQIPLARSIASRSSPTAHRRFTARMRLAAWPTSFSSPTTRDSRPRRGSGKPRTEEIISSSTASSAARPGRAAALSRRSTPRTTPISRNNSATIRITCPFPIPF
ncbi:MAG: TonB-dependent receptor [Rudaea sp.]|uniref:STN domain-containing protein n=1 Tax=Rudaea sp. TaxID=2136325 RepID=UPI0039E54F38